MEKRLCRSHSDRMIAGVCGGLGEYLGVDPVWLRLFFVLLLFATGFGFWAYLILWIVVPEEGRVAATPGDTVQANVQEMAERAREFGQSIQRGLQGDRTEPGDGLAQRGGEGTEAGSAPGPALVGIAFVLLGLFLLLNQFNLFWWLRFDVLWPLAIIALGGALLFSRLRR